MDTKIYNNYVLQVAEQGSLTKAAAALGISQPAISSGITALEQELGIQIFNRKSKPVTFTAEGQIYFDYLIKLQALSQDFAHRIQSYRKTVNNTVTVGGPIAYVNSVLTDGVIWLRRQEPSCDVRIKCAPMAELMEMATKGEINCFVSTSGELPPCFEKRLIHKEQLHLCIPKADPINRELEEYLVRPGQMGPSFDYSRLAGRTFVFLEQGQPMQKQITAFLNTYGIRPECRITVNQVSTAVNLALKGEGICIASDSALEDTLDLSGICIYALPEHISGRSIYIAYNKDLFIPDACQMLLEYLSGKV